MAHTPTAMANLWVHPMVPDTVGLSLHWNFARRKSTSFICVFLGKCQNFEAIEGHTFDEIAISFAVGYVERMDCLTVKFAFVRANRKYQRSAMTKKDHGAKRAVRRAGGPHPITRSMRMFAVVGSILCLNLFSALPAHADNFWTNAIEVPGLSSLNHTTAMTGTIVCTSKGNCVTGGSYTDSALNTQAYVATETAGVWSPAKEVAGALNVGGVAAVYAFSCPSEGNCTASGTFADGDNIQHAFALN
jgi:hypothetical protein